MLLFIVLGTLLFSCQAQTIPISKAIPKNGDASHLPLPLEIITNPRFRVPYLAAMYLNGRSFCDGSLISTRFVLTAAHCASGISTFTVILGAQAIDNANEEGRVVIETTQKIVHSSYNPNTVNNDIAIVNLGRDISLTENIQPIKLPSSSNTPVGNQGRVCDWDKKTNPGSYSSYIKCENVTIISNSICQQTFGNIIISSTLCAIGSESICNVNSGAPLEDLDSNTLIGFVSFRSSAGCPLGAPIGFVRITSFLGWITSNTGISG